MATERIDGNTLKRVNGILKRMTATTIRDSEAPGLAIRTYASGTASWSIVLRDLKMKIADLAVYGVDDLPALRALVSKVREMRKDGKDAAPLVAAFNRERSVEKAEHHAAVAIGDAMAWETARDKYVLWLKDHRSEDTYRTYRSALGGNPGSPIEKDFRGLAGKPIASITLNDLVQIRNNIVSRGTKAQPNLRQADFTVSVIKSFFKWVLNQPDVKLASNPARDLSKVMERSKASSKSGKAVDADAERSLLQEEIGLIIMGLETYPNVAARTGILLQLMTGQRRMTIAIARKDAFYDHPDFGKVWRLEDKVHAWRVLPLSPTAIACYEAAMMNARSDNPFLFPQQRERKVGGGMDGHMNERTLSEVLEELRAPGGILHALPMRVSTHDLRKAFISQMGQTMHQYRIGQRVLETKDIDMITHRNEGRDTTATMIYDKNPYLPIKAKILSEWEQWCLEGYDIARKKYGFTGMLKSA